MAPTIRTVDLVRSWLGQALRATGAAVVVPVAIIVALSLTAIGGSGLSGLGALSQVVSGPRAAGSDLTVDDGDSEIGSAVTQLAAGSTGAITAPGAPLTSPGPGARRWWRRRRDAGRHPGAPRRRRGPRRRRAGSARWRWWRDSGTPGATPTRTTRPGRGRRSNGEGHHRRHSGRTDRRGCDRRPRRRLRPARLPLVGAALLEDLDRDLLDGKRDRRLGLGGAHAHGRRPVALDQPVGD